MKNIYALGSFLEYITSLSINREGVECAIANYVVSHLELNNIVYPLKFFISKAKG